MSRRTFFTGSSYERARACPTSEALPHAKSTNPDAERGHAIHEFLHCVHKARALGNSTEVARYYALSKMPESVWREACEAIDLDALPTIDGAGYAAEVALAYDVELGTARELGRGLDRAYGLLRPTEIPLTADTLALSADGEGVFVSDYKSGARIDRVTPAARNPQLLLGALAASRAYGRTSASVAIIHIDENGEPWFDRATFDEWTLDAFASEVRRVAHEVQHARDLIASGIMPDTNAGSHCRYCPAYVYCPEKIALAREMATAPLTLRENVSQALTPEMAGKAYHLVQRAKEVVNRAADALYAYAQEHGPIDIGNGLLYGPKLSQRESVDGTIARKVISELHGTEIADAACEWDASKASIKRAMRIVATRTGAKISHLEQAALDAIGAAGGIDTKVSAPCKEYPAPKEPAHANG